MKKQLNPIEHKYFSVIESRFYAIENYYTFLNIIIKRNSDEKRGDKIIFRRLLRILHGGVSFHHLFIRREINVFQLVALNHQGHSKLY